MKVELTMEQFESLERIVVGISIKKQGWGGYSQEELEQELWLKVLNIVESIGEVPNLNLIASSCYNRVTDLFRHSKVVQHYGFSMEPGLMTEMDMGSQERPPSDDASMMVVNEMAEMFEPGSREREYFDLCQIWSGTDERSEKELKGLFFEGCREYEIAVNMGYKNQMSSGYRRIKARVQDAILEYQEGLRNERLEDIKNR